MNGKCFANLVIIVAALLLIVAFNKANAQDTTINYKGQPPASAMAPSMSAFSQDVCGAPISGAISSTVIGFSGGGVYTDANCERIKLAKTLNDLGLKVAAVAVLCQDERVWNSMELSGSPCPIDGLVGDAARLRWFKLHPDKFKAIYGKDFTITADTKPTGDK